MVEDYYLFNSGSHTLPTTISEFIHPLLMVSKIGDWSAFQI